MRQRGAALRLVGELDPRLALEDLPQRSIEGPHRLRDLAALEPSSPQGRFYDREAVPDDVGGRSDGRLVRSRVVYVAARRDGPVGAASAGDAPAPVLWRHRFDVVAALAETFCEPPGELPVIRQS